MKKDRICKRLILIACVACLACAFLPLLQIDLRVASDLVSRVFKRPEFALEKEHWTIISILKKMHSVSKRVKPYMVISAVCAYLPYLFDLTILLLTFVKRRAAAILSTVMALVTAAWIFVMHVIVAPYRIQIYATKKIEESVAGLIANLITENAPDSAARHLGLLYRSGLSWGFYGPLLLLCFVAALSFVRCISEKEEAYADHIGI